ncbi:methyltransferase domain-containing protein [Elioraea tepida]|jgi:SAM-dependent methyltransferase|uniref:Methyltransferase domain-containing protein n=1 Tax=Elioraea tepida TaxID=2843330 RepID=A0A975YI85_9PROT|nr:class I SAM-dependent methyltransferase [Elioraea tepida]QXM23440.1 methyltransferase domain-containing protein [Elioraea tepida]
MSRREPPPSPWQRRWQERYEAGAWLFGEAPNEWLVSNAWRLKPGMRALCPGEGEGRNAVFLASLGLAVTAVDFAPAALARARSLAARRGVAITTLCADLASWDWPEAAFDLVALIFVQLSPEERRAVHAGAGRALAPGGWLVLEAFARGGPPGCGPRTEESRYDAAMLRDDFPGLVMHALTTGTVLLDEGEAHRGEATVVRLLARRGA